MTPEQIEIALRPESIGPRPLENYIVVSASTLSKLMAEVNQKLNDDDYDLVGGFSSVTMDNSLWFCQAMVKTMD